MNSIFRRLDHSFLSALSAALFCCLIFAAGHGIAQEAASPSSSEQVDAVLVLDISGSMLLTDPLNLRQEGAKLFTQFLKKGDRLAVVAFSNEATVLRPLEPYDPSQQPAISSLITGAAASGEFTNLAAGIDKAVSILQNNHREKVNQTIILMSDGKMEPPPAADTAQNLSNRLAEATLPDLKKIGVKLYTLAFSDQADKELLQEFAALTDGISWFTPSAEKIHESFANLFLAVKKPQIAPLTKKGFKLDGDVQEATFYINREGEGDSIQIIRPDGKAFGSQTTDSDIKWFKGKQFDVITITQPAPGDWQLTGVVNQEGFATLLTKLRLVSEWPTNMYAQESRLLEVRLFEEDKPISLPEMSGTIQFAFQVTPTDKVSEPIIREFLNDDGKDGDRIARDGIFSKKIEIQDAGEYKLRVLAKAPTFERNQQIPFRVKAPLVRVNVIESTEQINALLEAPSGHDGHGGDGHDAGHEAHDEEEDSHHKEGAKQVIEVLLNDDVLSFKKFTIKLVAVDDHKSRFEIPLVADKLNKTKHYASVNVLPKAGDYSLQGVLNAETKRNQSVRGESKVIPYHYVPPKDHHEEVQVVQKTEKKPKKEQPASPVIPIILMTLLSGGAIYGVKMFLARSQQSSDSQAPQFSSLDEVNDLIAQLQQKMQLSEIDLTMPFLTSIDVALPPIWLSDGSGPMAASVVQASVQETVKESEDTTSSSEEEPVEAPQSEEEQASEESSNDEEES